MDGYIQDIIGSASLWPTRIRRLFWTAGLRHFDRVLLCTFAWVNGLNPEVVYEWVELLGAWNYVQTGQPGTTLELCSDILNPEYKGTIFMPTMCLPIDTSTWMAACECISTRSLDNKGPFQGQHFVQPFPGLLIIKVEVIYKTLPSVNNECFN
jgi:hypothetical protein